MTEEEVFELIRKDVKEYIKHQEENPDPLLTPSYHGVDCLGNGEHDGIECCCDECDYYLVCFPDWNNENPE